MGYDAKVKLMDHESRTKDWEMTGRAEKVLLSALNYIKQKDEKNIVKKVFQWMVKDWDAFDEHMNELWRFKK